MKETRFLHGPDEGAPLMRSMDSIPPALNPREPRCEGAYDARPLRKRTCLAGKLVYGSSASTLDCVIRDVSEKGAKIVLYKRQPLPLDIYLIVVKYGVAYRAKVMWLNFPTRGLEFSETHPLNSTLSWKLNYLRQVWFDLCARSGEYPIVDQWNAGQLMALCDSAPDPLPDSEKAIPIVDVAKC
jgi:hypothetical protein